MSPLESNSPELSAREFFGKMHGEFAGILAAGHDPATLTGLLVNRAFDLFEENIAIQTKGWPASACHKGCPSCCTLRVTATAPEIFLLAHYVRLVDATPSGGSIDLPGRIAGAFKATKGHDEKARVTLRQPCPLILKGVCIVHPVRPLACRGLVSFDRQACADALFRDDVEVPLSEPHLNLRALVQNALQSALRASALPWGLYELNQGLALALDDRERCDAWSGGADSLAPVVPEFDGIAMAATFDALLAER